MTIQVITFSKIRRPEIQMINQLCTIYESVIYRYDIPEYLPRMINDKMRHKYHILKNYRSSFQKNIFVVYFESNIGVFVGAV